MKVQHTVEVVYGSYADTTTIICDADDDLETIKAIVRKKLSLNFLSMATYRVTIISTQQIKNTASSSY